jgi:3-methyladenine DNA glycosylase AlkD
MTNITADGARERLDALASPEHAATLQRYFKTGPGEYGHGDTFIGVRVPQLRALVKEVAALPLAEVKKLLASSIHEERTLALLVMVRQYQRGDAKLRQKLYDLYLRSTRHINNWDLVDSSAEYIVGAHLDGGDRSIIDRLARSESLWERRIAVLATRHFLKRGDFGPTMKVAEMLLDDDHDLIHKAVGWLLREIGDRDREAEERFLRAHYRRMPRTMLRYAIEKFPEELRKAYLRGEIA